MKKPYGHWVAPIMASISMVLIVVSLFLHHDVVNGVGGIAVLIILITAPYTSFNVGADYGRRSQIAREADFRFKYWQKTGRFPNT